MAGSNAAEVGRLTVKISHLDQLLGLTGEIIIAANNMSLLQRHIQEHGAVANKESLEMAKSTAVTTQRISSDLHHLVMDIRLVPVKDIFVRLRRLVRDLARKKGRQVALELLGEETLIDKTVAERLYEPLVHQIRNAVDHGLEDPLERKQKGKAPQGQLTLSAQVREGSIYVRVTDDGRGLDEARIRHTAIDKGFVSPETGPLSLEQQVQLLVQPGFSTAPQTTEFSGRGVGMDVVKTTLDALGGELQVQSELGQGTTFIYKIPQLSAVNIVDALVVRAKDSFLAVPVLSVVATQALRPCEIVTVQLRSQALLYLGSLIPLYDLSQLLFGEPLEPEGELIPIIIIEAKNGRLALQVSEFISPQKLVISPMPDVLACQGLSGTTILGGNHVGLILDPFELIAHTQQKKGPVRSASAQRQETRSEPEVQPTPSDSPEPENASGEGQRGQRGPGERFTEEFFGEIQNILSSLSEEIFELEQASDQATKLNIIFRYFHSIKGNLMMTGSQALGAFVHDVESVLDRLRDKEFPVTEEVTDLLLDAVKMLEQALGPLRHGKNFQVTDPNVLSMLEKYRRRPATQVATESVEDQAFNLTALAQLTRQAKTAQGASVYQSLLCLAPRYQEPFLAAYLILKRMALLGDVIATVPSLEAIEQGRVGDKLKVLFATHHSQAEVDRFMDVQLCRHYGVVQFNNLLTE